MKAIPLAWIFLALLLLGSAASAETSGEAAAGEKTAAELDERHRRWLEGVELLISEAEREVFLALGENYQRDEFIRRFWAARDPFPRTARNEFRERWEKRLETARQRYETLQGDRVRMLLHFGDPGDLRHVRCPDVLRPLEVWVYPAGSDRIAGYFTLVFIGIQPMGRGPHHLWQPLEGIPPLLAPGVFAGRVNQTEIAREIRQNCFRGDDLLSDLAQSLDLSRLEGRAPLVPQPSDEWVRTFEARSTEMPEDAEPLEAELLMDYPGRHQSRTVVQGVVGVPRGAAETTVLGPYEAYRFVVDGEVLRQGELFDRFRYQFAFPPGDLPGEQIPLVVQRYLRPGAYTWIVKVEDLGSERIFREAREIEVPRIDPAQLAREAAEEAIAEAEAAAETSGAEMPLTRPPRPIVDRLAEANTSIGTGEHTIKILPVAEILQVGKLRVEARTRGEGIERVSFELDGRPVMRKSRPPYSVELDLGEKPKLHTLRATALDAEGRELATDEIPINAGPHRFALRLIEPQQGRQYRSSVRVHAEVEVPESERLDRVEIYLNETLQTTLYQPPFEHPLLLPPEQDVTYVRAVAYLDGGNLTEDVVFINAPDFVDEVKVQFVELYTSVIDRRGDFVEGLEIGDFKVREDGIEQKIRRFETVRDLPIHAGIVLDTSLSMLEELPEVERAAYRFLETVLTPRDRAAVITFADEPHLQVRFTNDRGVLAGGLAGMVAEGETALYDSLVFALHYFSGLRGQRAIVILTDGEDSKSTYTYEDAIEYAQRTGVAVYVIGLNLSSGLHEVRVKMDRIARETGGASFYVDRASQLGRAYDAIQQELRSQYLLAYQSSQGSGGEAFRKVEVEMSRRDLEAKTLRGYFP